MSADLRVEAFGHVTVVEITRPPNNFFDTPLVTALADRIEALDDDRVCRAILLASRGKHFCAGANFNRDPDERRFGGGALYQQCLRLFRTRKPIVAAVQGAAIGGGLGLALAADFRIAAPAARFAANFTMLGYHPGFGLTVTLPRLIGAQRAALLFATGRRVGGEEAVAMGLADRLGPEKDFRAAALDFANEIAVAAPLAQQATRATLRAGLVDAVTVALDVELAEQMALRETADFAEGIAASAERRPPRFTGR